MIRSLGTHLRPKRRAPDPLKWTPCSVGEVLRQAPHCLPTPATKLQKTERSPAPATHRPHFTPPHYYHQTPPRSLRPPPSPHQHLSLPASKTEPEPCPPPARRAPPLTLSFGISEPRVASHHTSFASDASTHPSHLYRHHSTSNLRRPISGANRLAYLSTQDAKQLWACINHRRMDG